jgi:cytochrome c oxidase assembly protein subunit 15
LENGERIAVAQEGAGPELKKPVIILAFVSIGLVYSTMLIGVFLSSGPLTEKGLACVDWPLCPNGFGPPEDRYMMEYVHRLVAAITAAVVYATAVVVPSSARRAKKASLIAAGLVSLQLVIGLLTVLTRLDPLLVASHLSTGVSLFAFGLLTFWWAGIWKKR